MVCMRRILSLLVPALVLVVSGCANHPTDPGVVLACYGAVNETVDGDGVSDPNVITNFYFGGCSPDDPGMQILQRTDTVRAAGDPQALIDACDTNCKTRLDGYHRSHRTLADQRLSCATQFVAPCDQLGSDLTNAALPVDVWAGGPADFRLAIGGTATIIIDQRSAVVPVHGIADVTFAEDCDQNNNCPIIIPRFDVVADSAFVINGVQVDTAHVQNNGIIRGNRNGQQNTFGQGSFRLQVNYTIHTDRNS